VFRDYYQSADETLVRSLAASQKWHEAFEELARPLHEALYQEQSFDLLDKLTPLEQLIICLDYVRMQVGQGGLIQLFQNKYTPLLVNVIEAAQTLHLAPELSKTLDDALKVYVLNNEALSRETTPEEFAKLYDEYREFEGLDEEFAKELPMSIQQTVLYAIT
jgi:hypothetical protein